jgi:spermidine synthase
MLHFFENSNISLHLSDLTILESKISKKKKRIQLFNHILLGKILVIDNEIQHVEAWACLYHEMLVHIPVSFIDKLERVLILGGGSLFTAKEILKYPSVKEVVMIDHDPSVIQLVEKNYSHASKILNDNRFDLKIGDAFDTLKKLNGGFDLIINDAVDLFNFKSLKTKKQNLFNQLNENLAVDGVCSDLIYRHIFEKELSINTIRNLKKNFNTAFSLVTVPEYPGVLHVLSMWGKSKNISQTLNISKNEVHHTWSKSNNPCEYFSPQFLNYYLYIPPYIKGLF